MRRRMSVVVPFAVPLVLSLAVLRADGQEALPPAAPVPAKSRCFHPAPLERCRTFPITEFGAGSRAGTERSVFIFWDYGFMRNRSASSAVGGSLHMAAGSDLVRFALSGRYRRWLSDGIPLDLAPGIILWDSDGYSMAFRPGFMAQAALSVHDVGGAFVQLEVRDAELGSGPTLRAGVKVGSVVGAAAGLVAPFAIYIYGSTRLRDTPHSP